MEERFLQQLKKGVLELLVLQTICQGPTYGYELTAQLPGYAFRKSPLRFVCLGAAVLALLAGLLKTVTNLRGFASVGVIGGADGPTEIFIAGPQIFDWADVIAAGIVLVLGLIGYLLLRRLPPKKG